MVCEGFLFLSSFGMETDRSEKGEEEEEKSETGTDRKCGGGWLVMVGMSGIRILFTNQRNQVSMEF